MKKIIVTILCVLLTLSSLAGCTPDQPATPSVPSTVPSPTESIPTEPPSENEYKYTSKTGYYLWPCLADNWVERKVLITTTDDGTFYCMTSDKNQASDFVIAQRTLLTHLRKMGLDTGALKYYATDYDDSFSASRDGEAYIALSALGTQQQVLVTLQALWGDYTDYGYVWAMSYAIAQEMGYETDPIATIDKATLDSFFTTNPDAIHLLYPSFTTKFASQETVDCCHALAAHLFSNVNWREAVAKPIETQLDAWYESVASYAEDIGVPFTRQTIGYAYYSQRVPLRIMTSYVEMMVADNYCDYFPDVYSPYFADYESIYTTVAAMNGEISGAVEFFGLENEVGIIAMKWVNFADNGVQKYLDGNAGVYLFAAETAYVSTIWAYLHEYYHHLRYVLSGDSQKSWQTEAFSEMGAANSFWPQYQTDLTFAPELYANVFYLFTGRAYQGGREDYYEAADIICYLNDTYALYYHDGGPTASFSGYLIDLYGEETAYQLVAFPETVEVVTGKSWEQLRSEWEQHIRAKYAHVDLPQGVQ